MSPISGSGFLRAPLPVVVIPGGGGGGGLVHFDDFNRVVVDDLGSALAPHGGAWTMSGSGIGNRGADGSSAYVTGSAWTAWVPGALWDLDPFTLAARVKLGTSNDQSSVRFAISDDLFDYAEVFLDGSGFLVVDDNIDFNEDSVDQASLSIGDWYFIKWQIAGAVSRAKYWVEGSTEPGWLVEAALPNLGGRTYLIMALAATTGTTLVDYIDFDSCTLAMFDDFERSVGSGWGSATPNGAAWNTVPTGSSVAHVDGTTGLLWRVGTADYVSASILVPITLAEGFDVLVLLQIGNPTELASDGLSFTINGPLGASFLELRLGSLTEEDMRLHTNTGGPYQLAPIFPFGDGIQYWMRLHYDSVLAGVRFWQDGTTEPVTWDLQISTIGDTPSSGQHALNILNGLQTATDASQPLYIEEILLCGGVAGGGSGGSVVIPPALLGNGTPR